MNHFFWYRVALIGIVFVFTGCVTSGKRATAPDPTGIQDYVSAAKQFQDETGNSDGSLWTNSGQSSSLFRDMKARYVNDVVTILVSESTQAVASANASSARSSSMSAGVDNLFGLEKRVGELPNMVSGSSKSTFNGKGSTSRATTVQTILTARVTDVLPNGYLVVEGKREVRINNENQLVILSGIVRPNDISKSNMVPSSAVAQMSVRVQGKGSVSQPIRPGWLFQILNGVLPF